MAKLVFIRWRLVHLIKELAAIHAPCRASENAGIPDQIEPFEISVAEAALDDLRDRLRRTR